MFIGINKYPRLREERQLVAAERDALRLYQYFVSAQVSGPLEAIVETTTWRPTRSNILSKFSKFVAAVPANTSALIYFAGHGFSLNNGLVLAGCDYVPSIGWDAGVPVRRLFELAKGQWQRNVKFLFFLDCCRSGVVHGIIDDIPANVLITYACSHGQAALEDQTGGLLTSALLSTIEEIASTSGVPQDSAVCGFHQILDRLQEQYIGITRNPDTHIEVIGERADFFKFPLVLTQSVVKPTHGPRCIISGAVSNDGTINDQIRDLQATVRLWSGLRSGDDSIKEWLSRTVVWNTESRELSVVLQAIGPFASGAVLLQELLNRFHTIFDTLRIEWPININLNLLRSAFHGRNGTAWIETPDGDIGMRWNNAAGGNQTSGQGWLLERSEFKTVLHIECRNELGDPLSLSYLQPSIIEIYQLLNSLKGNHQ